VNTVELRRRGFRCIRPTDKAAYFSNLARQFGYSVQMENGRHWIRKHYRRRGSPVPTAVKLGPTITQADAATTSTYSFLAEHTRSTYAQFYVDLPFDRVVRMVASARERSEAYQKYDLLTRALAFCPPQHLRVLLQEHVLPEFFREVPDGRVRVFMMNDEIESGFRVLRGGYVLDHYPMASIEASRDQGFALLENWEGGQIGDWLEPLLSILQMAAYPYIPFFHGGPLGLLLVFFFPEPYRHELKIFPASWLHAARSDALFGTEARTLRGLFDPASEERLGLAHRRMLTERPLPMDFSLRLVDWAVSRISDLVREAADAANFEAEGFIDFTFAFELSLSLIRVLKRAALALTTEEPPTGKFLAFEVADLLDALAKVFDRRQETETFKLLFNANDGRAMMRACLASAPEDIRLYLEDMAARLYEDLRETAAASVWLAGMSTPRGILVRNRDLSREALEDPASFAANLMRALRNTHHGYFTRLDRNSRRPARYLVLSTGNTPDSLSQFPFLWTVALLADPGQIIGWRTLETEYED